MANETDLSLLTTEDYQDYWNQFLRFYADETGKNFSKKLPISYLDKLLRDEIIEKEDIEEDFRCAYDAIRRLPKGARIGVLTAYRFYRNLFRKIQRSSSEQILQERIRISNAEKAALLCYSVLEHRLS